MELKVTTLTAELDREEFISGFVDIERFLACCAECRGFGKTWACPPYDFDPMELWKSCSSVLLYAKKVELPEEALKEEHEPAELARIYNEVLAPVKAELMRELYELEKQTPGSVALSAGGCDICAECTRPMGLPCRSPELMRYSVESMGGNVLKCITDVLGETVLWAENGRLPEHYLLLGGLLKRASE